MTRHHVRAVTLGIATALLGLAALASAGSPSGHAQADIIQPQSQAAANSTDGGWVYSPQGWQPDWND